MRPFFSIAGVALVLSACASQAPRETALEAFADDPRFGAEVNQVCFASTIDSFSNPETRTVVIRDGQDHYLVEVFGGCVDLKFAQSLAVRARTGCLTRGDYIIASDSVFGLNNHASGRAERCSIKNIYAWDPDAADEATDTEEES